MINLRSQVFATKEQEEQNTKKKKNKLCVLKTFRECLKKKNNCKKKIENKQSDIKLTWSNHKKKGFCCDHGPSSLRAVIQSIDSYLKQLQRLDTDISNNCRLSSLNRVYMWVSRTQLLNSTGCQAAKEAQKIGN